MGVAVVLVAALVVLSQHDAPHRSVRVVTATPITTSTTDEPTPETTSTTGVTLAPSPTVPAVTVPATTPPVRVNPPSTTLPKPFGAVASIDGPGIYLINIDGTGLRRLSKGSSDTFPSFSPDGNSIAYTANFNQLHVVTQAGRDRTVATNVATQQHPSWSPDGTHIAYPGPGAGSDRDPWVVAADGQTPARQLAEPGDDGNVDWGRTNRIVSIGSAGLVAIDPSGQNRQVIDGEPLSRGIVRWSPDASAVVAMPDSTATDLIVNADGSNPRQLGHGDGSAPEYNYDEADWAPSSQQLVYWENARRTGTVNILVAPGDGRAGAVIESEMNWPAWSPKGDLIAAAGKPDGRGRPLDVVTFAPTGGPPRSLVSNTKGLMIEHPRFSLNGTSIVFAAVG